VAPIEAGTEAADGPEKSRVPWSSGVVEGTGSGKLKRYPDEFFYQQMGLICLPKLPQSLPWAKA
jgi:hypothetical protein